MIIIFKLYYFFIWLFYLEIIHTRFDLDTYMFWIDLILFKLVLYLIIFFYITLICLFLCVSCFFFDFFTHFSHLLHWIFFHILWLFFSNYKFLYIWILPDFYFFLSILLVHLLTFVYVFYRLFFYTLSLLFPLSFLIFL